MCHLARNYAALVSGAVFALSIGLNGVLATEVYPAKPIRLVVTFAPGGGTDVFARALAQKFTEGWGQPVVVDNRAGANGNIGSALVAEAPPDGYTLLVTTNATIVINPNLYKKIPFDSVKDFSPISLLSTVPFVLSVVPSLPVKSVADLIALAKAKPGKFAYAHTGAGGGGHLSGQMLETMSKIDVTAVPYKGGAPALTALLSGEVQFSFVSILTSTPLVKSGRLRAVAVTSERRSPALPDIPTVAETRGLDGFETDLWYGMLAPAKTDRKIVDKIYQETRRILSTPEFRERFESMGARSVASSPDQFSKTIKSDLAKWAALIKATGAHL